MLVYLYTFRIDKIFSDRGRVFGIKFFQIPVLSPILELGEKVFPGEVGSGKWEVGIGEWELGSFLSEQ
jgi:hypothetical protein